MQTFDKSEAVWAAWDHSQSKDDFFARLRDRADASDFWADFWVDRSSAGEPEKQGETAQTNVAATSPFSWPGVVADDGIFDPIVDSLERVRDHLSERFGEDNEAVDALSDAIDRLSSLSERLADLHHDRAEWFADRFEFGDLPNEPPASETDALAQLSFDPQPPDQSTVLGDSDQPRWGQAFDFAGNKELFHDRWETGVSYEPDLFDVFHFDRLSSDTDLIG